MSFQEKGEGMLINLYCIDYGSILQHVLHALSLCKKGLNLSHFYLDAYNLSC